MADYNDQTGRPGQRGAKAGFTKWKPDACECGAPHPSHSWNGREGPWRCRKCHRLADPSRPTVTIIDPYAPADPPPPPAPKREGPDGQGLLI